VDRDDVLGAGLLVQRIDVLGDYRRKPAGSFEPGQETVGEGRLDGVDHAKEVTGELVERCWVTAKGRDIEDRVRVVAAGDVEALWSAEVRDVRSGRDAGTGHPHHSLRPTDEVGASFGIERLFVEHCFDDDNRAATRCWMLDAGCWMRRQREFSS
jgi:hypothetical protein